MAGEARRRGAGSRRWLWGAALLVPLALAAVTQLDAIQTADGHFVTGLWRDIGKWDIIADILAPVWALSIVAIAALNRRVLDRFDPDPDFVPTSRLGRRFATDAWIRRSTWIATGGAVLLISLSWTREWEGLGEQPDALWFVLVLLGTLVLSAVPLWWVRLDLEEALRQPLERSSAVSTINRYLFASDEAGPARWPQLVALAAITSLAVWVALGQLDALLQGMHLTDQASHGIGSLTRVFELDLSQKPVHVSDVVATWAAYSEGLGSRFESASGVLNVYLLIDTFVFVPTYLVLVGVLLLRARKATPPDLTGRPHRSYELLVAAGIGTLVVVAAADVVENLFIWIVVSRIWNGDQVASWSVRVMWAGGVIRTIGVALLVVGVVLILALRQRRLSGVFQSLVAVRGELLVIALLTLALTALPQTSDVVRRWTVSVALITTGFVIALAMFLHWTASRTLHGLQQSAERVSAGEALAPARVSLPWLGDAVSLRRVVVVALLSAFAVQLLVTVVLDIPLGLRLAIPAALIGVLWLFGLPLPPSQFARGDRSIADLARRTVPRLLGAAVLVILGATVLKAAVAQLVFARHVDVWLLFALLPLAVGLYRLHTKTGPTLGRLEAVIILGVGLAGLVLIVTANDPELSPVALTFAGLMIMYGAMPFFYSYEPASGPSRFSRTRMQVIGIRPILAVGMALAVVTVFGLVFFPLELAPTIGTIAVMVLAAMLFAGVAAALVGFAEWTRPPDILAAFHFKRTPVFVFLFVWLVLAGGSGNDIPVTSATTGVPGAQRGITIDDVWERWLERNSGALAGAQSSAGPRPAVPIVFIASSGGGVRAAVWTGYVMDCLFDDGNAAECATDVESSTRSILAMSGVSGGSIGLASFAGSSIDDGADGGDWVKARLGDDYLAAAMTWLAFVDTPQTFLGFGPNLPDRASIMELAFERSWETNETEGFLSRGVFEIWYEEPQLPVLIFNGTSVNDPCRFNVSVLDANAHLTGDTCTSLRAFEGSTTGVDDTAMLAATKDLIDYLCPGQDIKLSTATLLTARFPVISPSGRVGGGLADCGEEPADAYVVDGGYLEGSAAGTLIELWDHLETRIATWNSDERRACLVPFFLQIDNGYENPSTAASGRRPREALVPLSALFGSQFGRMANAREQAAIEFDLPLTSAAGVILVEREGVAIKSRYARLTTRAHPGVQAPLGWTLSTASMDDLRNQLLIDENQRELGEVRSWLDGNLTCSTEVQQ